MKRSDLVLSTILVPVDIVMLMLAGLSAYALRFSSSITNLLPIREAPSLQPYLEVMALVIPLWIIVLALAGLYHLPSIRQFAQECIRIILASSTAIMVFILVIFFQRELFSSRFIVLVAWFLAIVFLLVARLIVRLIHKRFLVHGVGLHKVLLFGADHTTELVLKYLRDNPTSGFRVVGYFSSFSHGQRPAIERILEREDIDDVMLADPTMPHAERMALLDFATEHNRTFRYAADLFETKVSQVDLSTIATIPFFEVKHTPLDGWGKILKRLVDMIGSSFGLLLLSPLFLIVALVVKLTSPGPVFFAAERVGQRGKYFRLYKFRSMVHNAHVMKNELLKQNERPDGPLFKMRNDPRITRLGRFLRASSIDELPQLWNVLNGNMSLIGPRPHEPEEVAQYQKHHKQVLFIRPGITGMAQVSGRSELKFEDEIRLDVYYIENWSLALDLQILLKTFWVVLTRYSQAA